MHLLEDRDEERGVVAGTVVGRVFAELDFLGGVDALHAPTHVRIERHLRERMEESFL